MVPFTVTLLICIHRITIEYTALNFSCLYICFDFFGITEFASTIGNNNLKKHPELKGIFALNETSTQLGIQVLDELDNSDEIQIVGFDAGKEQVKAHIQYYMNNAQLMKRALTSIGLKTAGGEDAPYLWVKAPDGLSSWKSSKNYYTKLRL